MTAITAEETETEFYRRTHHTPIRYCDAELKALEAVMEHIDPATFPGLTTAQRCALGRFAKPKISDVCDVKCGCEEFCERSGHKETADGISGWFCPYIPEVFGGPGPECKMLNKVSGMKIKVYVDEHGVDPNYTGPGSHG